VTPARLQQVKSPVGTPAATTGALLRKARVSDVGSVHQIINHYANQQLMLPKTHLQLYENLRDFTVAMDPIQETLVLGCGALHIYWENIAEIRALAVRPGTTQRGIGTLLVEKLIEEAREYELQQVFAFTYVPKFFARFGFDQVEHSALPLKVYNECFYCPKFNTCDEVAMVLEL
jgi:amino-acid N-acetyltransferase